MSGKSGPVVSVVIPTYNRSALLLRAVKSALKQTLKDIEVIVVVDGSLDNTPEATRKMDDPRVRFIHHDENRGAPAARNTGIRAAKGAYIAFLDDDDEWLPNKLERQTAVGSAFSGSVCGYALRKPPSNRIERFRELKIKHLKKGNRCPTSCLVLRASIAKKLEFDESLPKAQDWDLLMRLVKKNRVAYVPEILCMIDAGGHPRITNAAKKNSLEELEFRAAATWKHAVTLGRYWVNYRLAMDLTSYIASSEKKSFRLWSVVQRCGCLPTGHVLFDKAKRRISRHITRLAVKNA